jgi:hypothetical protein
MKKEVQLLKKSNGKLLVVSIDEFYESETYTRDKPTICETFTQEPFGWWLYESTNKHGASDGIGDEKIVRELTGADFERILANNGRCFIEVDHNNKLRVPKNGRGDGKIVLFETK